MAQSNTLPDGRNDKPHVRFSANAAVSVAAAGNTTILQLRVDGMERLFVQFDVATNNLDAFLIKAKAHPDATAATLYSAAGDFTAPIGLLLGSSGDLTAVAAGSSGWFVMDVRGLHEVTIQASATGGAAAVTVYAGGQ